MTSQYLDRPHRSIATVAAELLEQAAEFHAKERPDLARQAALQAARLITLSSTAPEQRK